MCFLSGNTRKPAQAARETKGSRPGGVRAGQAGFSLLEVLIALAVLAILGTVTLRGVHQSQDTLANNRWKDIATRFGRNLLYERELSGARELAQSGSFSPEYPSMRWRFEAYGLNMAEGSRAALVISQEQGTQLYETRIEFFDAIRTQKE